MHWVWGWVSPTFHQLKFFLFFKFSCASVSHSISSSSHCSFISLYFSSVCLQLTLFLFRVDMPETPK